MSLSFIEEITASTFLNNCYLQITLKAKARNPFRLFCKEIERFSNFEDTLVVLRFEIALKNSRKQ